MAKVVLAYWAPVYVTVDTDAGRVQEVRLVQSGLRSGPPISGQPAPNGVEREAARLFIEALAGSEPSTGRLLPPITIG
jgi:hypothetical protein